jgi:hypothetical protein
MEFCMLLCKEAIKKFYKECLSNYQRSTEEVVSQLWDSLELEKKNATTTLEKFANSPLNILLQMIFPTLKD